MNVQSSHIQTESFWERTPAFHTQSLDCIPNSNFHQLPKILGTIAPEVNPGTARETFFMSMLRPGHELRSPAKGDFLVDDRFLFEVGGRGKGFGQIKDATNSYLALEGMETGFGWKIPLWLFGFLY